MAMRVSTPRVGRNKVLAAATGAEVGKIGTVAASGILYVRCDCNKNTPATDFIDWLVKANKASTMLFYKSRTIANTGTITLADATPLDDTNSFFLNGVELIAEDTLADATGAKFYSGGADETVTATALAACINANVPGVLATAAARVVTVVCTTASTLMFLLVSGTDANEAAWADNTLANLMRDSSIAQVTGADNSATLGTLYKQDVDGYPYCYLGYTSTDGAAATALSVSAAMHD